MCGLVIIITICILISMCGCLVFAFMEVFRLNNSIPPTVSHPQTPPLLQFLIIIITLYCMMTQQTL